MQLLSGPERRAQWLAPGTEACRGQLIELCCCRQSAAYSQFRLASDRDATVSDALSSSSSNGKPLTAKVSLKLCDHGDDIEPLLTTASSCPRITEAHANQIGIWVSVLWLRSLSVGLPPLGCRQRRCLLAGSTLAAGLSGCQRMKAASCHVLGYTAS